jgi:flagellar basal body-associated protein FliL
MIITIFIIVGLVVILLGTWLYCAVKISGKISKNEREDK